MAGRRRTGALAGAANLATQLLGYQMEQQQERRRRAEDIFLKLSFERQLNEQKRAEALAQLQQGALAGTDLVPGGYTDPVTGVEYKNPTLTNTAPSETEAQRLLFGTTPGQPFPATASVKGFTDPATAETTMRTIGGLPSSRGGSRLLQSLIETPVGVPGGVLPATESPAAMYGSFVPPAPPAPPAAPAPSRIPTMLGNAARVVSGMTMGGARRPVTPMRQPPRAPARTTPSVDIPSLITDATQALSEGFSEDDIRNQLASMGVDQQTIEQILSQASQ